VPAAGARVPRGERPYRLPTPTTRHSLWLVVVRHGNPLRFSNSRPSRRKPIGWKRSPRRWASRRLLAGGSPFSGVQPPPSRPTAAFSRRYAAELPLCYPTTPREGCTRRESPQVKRRRTTPGPRVWQRFLAGGLCPGPGAPVISTEVALATERRNLASANGERRDPSTLLRSLSGDRRRPRLARKTCQPRGRPRTRRFCGGRPF